MLRRVLAIALIGLLLVGCQAAPAPAARTAVKFGVNAPSFPYLIPYLAREAKLFEEQNLDVEFMQTSSGAQSPQLVLSGDVDFATADMSHVVIARSKGQDLAAVAGIMQDMGLTYVVTSTFMASRGIDPKAPMPSRLKDLKGARMAVAGAGTTGEIVLRQQLQAAGLNPDTDVQLSTISSASGREAAAQKGDLDVFQATSPYDASARRKGIGQVLFRSSDVEDLQNVLGFVIITRDATLSAKPDATRRFVAALTKAEQMVQSDPSGAAKLAQKIWADVDPAAVEESITSQKSVFPSTPRMDTAGADRQAQWLLRTKLIPSFVAGSAYIRNDYAQR